MELTDDGRKALWAKVRLASESRGRVTMLSIGPRELEALLRGEETVRFVNRGLAETTCRLRAEKADLLNRNAMLLDEVARLQVVLEQVGDQGQVFACRVFMLQQRVEEQARSLRVVAEEMVRLSAMEANPRHNRLAAPVPDWGDLSPLAAVST